MKVSRALYVLMFLILASGVSVPAVQKSPGSVTITYVLHKIPRIASNQIAVWIEDGSGNYVRTVFATRFTARGGFKKRTQALPAWVEASGWKNASAADVDAVSGATQKAGTVSLVWDCTDGSGEAVAAGTYVYKIEGNIFWDNRIVWEGRIDVGGKPNASSAKATYFPPDAAKKGVLIERVDAEYK